MLLCNNILLIVLGIGSVLSGTMVSKSDQPFWAISTDKRKIFQKASMAKDSMKVKELI